MKNFIKNLLNIKIKEVVQTKEQYVIEEAKKRKLPMNELTFKQMDSGELCAWLNPHDQDCFNAGWYTIENFLDFFNGTGPIIKGKTQEHKNKFLKYAEFKRTYIRAWGVCIDFEHFDKIKIEKFERNSWDGFVENPLKANKNQFDNEEFIMKSFGFFIPSLIRDLDGWSDSVCDDERYDRVEKEFRENSYGMGVALMIQGFGYFGTCNTPTEVRNFSWYRDVVFNYAYYQHLLKFGVEMPDFNFVHKNRYKM